MQNLAHTDRERRNFENVLEMSHHHHCIELQPESLVALIDRRAWVHLAASVMRMRED